MRPFLIFAFILAFGFAKAQTNPKPLTDEEIMYPDKLNGTLIDWTKEQKDAFIIDCKFRTEKIFENSKSFCKCAMKSMMTGINYERYAQSSEYQKGNMTSKHGSLNCKAVRKDE